MSEVAHELITTLNDEHAGITEVRNIIAKDPALTARLLRLANSAQFGLQRSISTLDDAITMVGMSKVRTLCLGSCLSSAFPALPGLDRKEFWRGSMACAGYAQWLANTLGMDGQEAWLCGMMLRLGELLIAQAEPATLLEIEKLPLLPGARWEREIRLVGHSEGQISGELARRWNFPKSIVAGLQQSSDPLGYTSFSRLAGIVHLAGLLADTPTASADAMDSLPADVMAKLLLDTQWSRNKFPDTNSFVDITSA